MNDMRVSEIIYYPLKGSQGIAINYRVRLDHRGVPLDRNWMLVNEQRNFVSQRTHPKMALIKAQVLPHRNHPVSLFLTLPSGKNREVFQSSRRPESATVHGAACQVFCEDEEVSEWLSSYLGAPCRLVRMAEDFERIVSLKYADYGQLSLADGAPILVTTTKSLFDFNWHLEEIDVKVSPISMNRFRPNIVIDGVGETWQEDRWKRISIGGCKFEMAWHCKRCKTINVNQETGKVDDFNYMNALAKYHQIDGAPIFGQNAIHLDNQTISIGDTVEILEWK